MDFNSLSELKKYVEKAQRNSAKALAKKQEDKAKDIVEEGVYEKYTNKVYARTEDIKNSAEGKSTNNSVVLTMRDNGSWHSVITGEHVYAFDMLEGGWTWGTDGEVINGRPRRPKTEMKNRLKEYAENELPQEYKNEMRKNNIPIE